MTTPSNPLPESALESRAIASAAAAPQPMYWSVRRELWENHSIYVAPLVASGVVMLGFLISLHGMRHSMRELAALDPAGQRVMLAMPYSHAAWLLIVTGFLVAVFYSLDALHGERRDRSILFWKSLPVSDLTTVLSKASIPLVVLPLLIFMITVALQLVMLLFSSAALLMSGAAASSAPLPLFQMELVLLYGLIVLTLWHAPLYGWLLLISGWARRTTFLWAVLPPVAICVLEGIAFHTSHFASLLGNRFVGFAWEAFSFTAQDGTPVDPHFIPLAQLTPGKFLSSPGLWIGLAVAAAFIAAAVRLRRYREPI
jgi:ABC-2 type transport system permease protein